MVCTYQNYCFVRRSIQSGDHIGKLKVFVPILKIEFPTSPLKCHSLFCLIWQASLSSIYSILQFCCLIVMLYLRSVIPYLSLNQAIKT